MKIAGWLLTVIAAAIVWFNVAATNGYKQAEEAHPLSAFFARGGNLKPAYTFSPPYAGFEVAVMLAALVGVGLIVAGTHKAD